MGRKRTLSRRKLAKKYANTVRLRLTTKTANKQIKEVPIQNMGVLRSEDWYRARYLLSQRNSGIVDVDYHQYVRSDGDTIVCNGNVKSIQRQSVCNLCSITG